MAVIVKRNNKYYLRAFGGHRNKERIPPSEIEINPPLTKVDEWDFRYPDNALGEGYNHVRVYKDSQGKMMCVHTFRWMPALSYAWEEEWEVVTEDPKEIERLRSFKEEVIEENL